MRCLMPVPRVRPNGGVAAPRFASGSHSHQSSALEDLTPSVGDQRIGEVTVDGSEGAPGKAIWSYLASAYWLLSVNPWGSGVGK